MSVRISDMCVELFRVPLGEVVVDALHGNHTHMELVTVTLTDTRGGRGTGYTYTGGKGGRAILEMIDSEIRERIS